ncbi:bifunctional DNA primase/polymerase [Actinophytocola sp. S1-96]|uniref:Bifunctional DNA primase/polymerase n=1 Tax=Actinophytocola gossypii TaxID=2812003 RepID=A0ABT2JIS6_9PSEU|nr:bifunctional DNA primase/polymerase [Actinophytocola gossypii]
MLTAALDAASRGWHVFPLRPGTKKYPALHGKENCTDTGPCANGHVGWEQRATTDPGRIRAAWSRAPYNIGIATGPSGLVVVDLDTDKGDAPPPPWNLPGVRDGQDVLAVLAEHHGQPVPVDTFTAATPSGGVHLYFRAPSGVELRSTVGDKGKGIGWRVDTRAHGGYLVAPGSVVARGAYRIVVDREPAPLPAWLVDLLRPAPRPPRSTRPVSVGSSRRSRYLEAAVRMECQHVEQARNGQRNASLYAAACALGQLVAGGALAEGDVTAALLTAAGRHIAVGAYPESQARATIRSGLAKGGAIRRRKVA